MKKMLLIAAMAALAFGASADGYKIEQLWHNTEPASLYLLGSRQGVGMNGKFYINDMRYNAEDTDYTIYIYGENGLEGTMPGYANSAITRDEAGHLVVMDNTGFAAHTNDDPWPFGASIRVIDLETNESKEYQIPPDALLSGRCDFLGFPKGDLMEDGEIYITSGASRTIFSIIAISGGEIDTDNSYRVTNDLTLSTTSTVINYYIDANGEEALLYVTRNAPMVKIPMSDLTGGEKLTLPFRGPSNGAFPFVFDGKEFILYPYKSATDVNYLDGFIISELGAEEPTVIVPATIAAPINTYQNNWLNAEVDESGVTIYHYYPGGYVEVYRMSKEDMVYTVVGPENVFGSNWDTSDENNDMVMGEDGIYTWSAEGVALYGDLEFKVVGNHDYSIYEWPMGQNNWVAHLPEGEAIYDILITFDPTADDADRITCTLTKVGDVTPVEHTYTVAGTENLFGSNWVQTDTNNDMVMGEDGIYTWTKNGVVFDEDVHIEFKVVQDHSWAVNWPSQNWMVDLEAGTYDIVITFDPAADVMDKITFTATRTDVPPVGLRGDVDQSGEVGIADVTALIDILLSGSEAPQEADCNLDNEIGIADVTALIDYLLSGVWSD